MPLTRRDFSAGLAAGLGGTLASPPLAAQPGPVQDVHYVRLAEPAPVTPGKIEVVEFFWYECPHCNAFEPALEAWARRQPEDVAFRRVPIWFREEPFTAQQRLFYALESLGVLETLHRRIYYAIHAERTRLRSSDEMVAFVTRNGVDGDKFMAAFNSFAVQAKGLQARQTAAAYKIDAVPAMGVQGRYYTNGTLANAAPQPKGSVPSNDRMLVVVDALVTRARKGGKA
ncbi:MAG TPA: thiol:disulfide interchange protein DsbA/DsbL [Caldimonas sp.]|jgi:thiol:disulfide interchange protein DsbA|nr:thiol:disulfide interchange protein DsbA/DsbL [Caldimonas sp.]HEX2540920.1 thiol:disulfide interchange protein DsbA/DsbL [Caldimonas sp.]